MYRLTWVKSKIWVEWITLRLPWIRRTDTNFPRFWRKFLTELDSHILVALIQINSKVSTSYWAAFSHELVTGCFQHSSVDIRWDSPSARAKDDYASNVKEKPVKSNFFSIFTLSVQYFRAQSRSILIVWSTCWAKLQKSYSEPHCLILRRSQLLICLVEYL